MNEPIIVVCDNPDIIREALEMEQVIKGNLCDIPVATIAHISSNRESLAGHIVEILGRDEIVNSETYHEVLVIDGQDEIELLAIDRLNKMVLKSNDMICAPEYVAPYVKWDRVKDWEQRNRQRPRRNKRRK